MGRALMISGIASGTGKTTVTAALARLARRRGLTVQIFKVGPDFLDPLVLAQAAGSSVDVIDLWMVGEAATRVRLTAAVASADLVLVEGAMGLYDGEPSAADLARRFDLPVIAVLDVAAMAQTVGAIARGLRDHGPVSLAGVIANRIASPGHAELIQSALLAVPLLGWLPAQSTSLPERHLGLVPAAEVRALDSRLETLAETLRISPVFWTMLETSASGNTRAEAAATPAATIRSPGPSVSLSGRTIAIARDLAFAFIYAANLECLAELGARVIFFSPLADEAVPSADAIWLPGGYPELHASTLSEATRFKASIRSAHVRAVPILAECGGLMTLAESIEDLQSRSWPMVGLLSGRCVMQRRLAALGLQAIEIDGHELRGHAFHYSRFETALPFSAQARCHPRGNPGERLYRVGSLIASYFHAYFPSNPALITRWLRASA